MATLGLNFREGRTLSPARRAVRAIDFTGGPPRVTRSRSASPMRAVACPPAAMNVVRFASPAMRASSPCCSPPSGGVLAALSPECLALCGAEVPLVTTTCTELKGCCVRDPIVRYVGPERCDPCHTGTPADCLPACDPSTVALLKAHVNQLEAENIRLSDSTADVVTLRDKYNYMLSSLGRDHAHLFDRLSRQRDDEYLQLLDHYEEAVRDLQHLLARMDDQEAIQQQLRRMSDQLRATEGMLEAADALRRKEKASKPPSINKNVPTPEDFNTTDQIWVCLTPSAGKLLLHPSIPESALSASSAAKIAEYLESAHQQEMRRQRFGAPAESQKREEDHLRDIDRLRREVSGLRRKLQGSAGSRRPSDDESELRRLRDDLRQRDALLRAQQDDLLRAEDALKRCQEQQQMAPGDAAGRRPGGGQQAAHNASRGPSSRLYCISEYGRIVHDNEQTTQRLEKDQATREARQGLTEGSQWSQWTR